MPGYRALKYSENSVKDLINSPENDIKGAKDGGKEDRALSQKSTKEPEDTVIVSPGDTNRSS